MKICLIRHGQTTGDVEDRYGGDYDDELTKMGAQQSQNLATELANLGITELYVSPKIRARQTSEIVGQGLGLSPTILTNFRE